MSFPCHATLWFRHARCLCGIICCTPPGHVIHVTCAKTEAPHFDLLLTVPTTAAVLHAACFSVWSRHDATSNRSLEHDTSESCVTRLIIITYKYAGKC